MNRDELMEHLEEGFEICLETVRRKNNDYAGEAGDNPFANFESSVVVGVSVERAMLVRWLDKVKRISNLLEQDAMVEEESINDTLLDAINYPALLRAYLISQGVISTGK